MTSAKMGGNSLAHPICYDECSLVVVAEILLQLPLTFTLGFNPVRLHPTQVICGRPAEERPLDVVLQRQARQRETLGEGGEKDIFRFSCQSGGRATHLVWPAGLREFYFRRRPLMNSLHKFCSSGLSRV